MVARMVGKVMDDIGNTSSECDGIEYYKKWAEHAYLPEYCVLTPIYFIFGMFGRSVLLWAFYQQWKKESAFMYQIFLTVSEMFEITMYALYVVTFDWWSDAVYSGADWYMSCYSCVWYAARLATPLLNVFITISMLLTIAISIDRLYALTQPFTYKFKNHTRRRMAALICCVCIGVTTSIFDCFRFKVVEIDQFYKVVVDYSFVTSHTGKALAHLRNAVRMIGVITLVGCNVALIVLYRRCQRRSIVNSAGSVSSASLTNEAGKTRRHRIKETEKTLVILTICQCVLNTIGVTFLVGYYMAIYVLPTFHGCQALLWMPIIDAVWQLSDVADFYIFIFISRKIRRMILASFPCTRKYVMDTARMVAKENGSVRNENLHI